MSGTVWIKHPGLDAVSEVPASALPQWRQAGWDLLSDAELDELEREAAEESAAAEAWLRSFSGIATEEAAPPPSDVQPSSSDADEPPAETEEGNG